MDIAKELQEAKQKQVETVKRINDLERQRQQLIQEALRLEGEIRLLSRLSENGDASTPEPTESS